MAGATRTTADAALKLDYQPAIREQINNDIMWLTQIEKDTENIEGKYAVLSLHVSRNAGVGARAELGTLPTAGSQGFAEQRIPVFYNYGRMQVSGPVIKAMKSDTGSFERVIDGESKRLVSDVKRDVNRQLFGTSDGAIASAASNASLVVTLDAATSAVQMRQFEVGMRVDIGTLAQLAAGSGGPTYGNVITAVDRTNLTITLTDALGSSVASGDYVARAGSGGSGANQKELTGLQTIVDSTGTVFNVDPSTYPVWSSYESSSGSNRQPTDTLFETAVDEVHLQGDGDPDTIITSHGVRRAYANQLKTQKRFANTVDLKGGFKGLSVDVGDVELALTAERDCPANTAFVLDSKRFKEFVMSDWEFMEEDGAVLSRISGTDAYEAILFKYHEQATDARNAHAKITQLTEA